MAGAFREIAGYDENLMQFRRNSNKDMLLSSPHFLALERKR